jgi:hypothetical protein
MKEEIIAKFADGPERDAALRGIIARERPESAAQTALRIGDPQARHDALDDFVVDWLKQEPAKAQQWLNSVTGTMIPREWSAAWVAESQGRKSKAD